MNPSSWLVSTIAGSKEGYVDGDCKAALFRSPSAFAFSPQGHLYLSDRINNSIRKIDLDARTVKTVDRTGLNQPTCIVWSPSGYFLITDRNNHKIKMLKVDEGSLQHFSGSDCGYADGASDVCRFWHPSSLFPTPDGQAFVSDLGNDRIRLLAKDGSATTYAGSYGGFADGPRHKALFSKPWGLFLSAYSELFICDWGNNRIRMIDSNGVVSTIAGTDKTGSADGIGSLATFNCPISIVLTPQNDLLVADRNNHRIRCIKKSASGWEVSTFAGSTSGLADGKCSSDAKFTQPAALAWTPSGQLLVSSNDCVRIIDQVTLATDETDSELSTSLDVLFNAPFFDLSFSSYSGPFFSLHLPILASRCEAMTHRVVRDVLEALDIPTEPWQLFFDFLYIDRLPSLEVHIDQKQELAITYCFLHMIAHICGMDQLENHCKHSIKVLSADSPEILSHLLSVIVSKSIPCIHPLFNFILDLIYIHHSGDKHKTVAAVGALLASKLSYQEVALEYITSKHSIPEHSSTSHLATGSLYVQLSTLCSVTPEAVLSSASSSRPPAPLVPFDYAIVIESERILCHKCILYARWPYFRTMMNAGLSEALDGEATFSGPSEDGFSVDAMKALIWFFYSNSPALFTQETGVEIMIGAGRYGFVDFSTNVPKPGFEELIRFCSVPLQVTPTLKNAVVLHKLAIRVQDDERLKTTRTTILANLPAIFLDPKLKAEFESLDVEEKYYLLEDAFGKMVGAKKDQDHVV